MEKDYSLLRPFDLEAAKCGDKLLWASGDEYPCRYLAGPDGLGDVAFEDSEGYLFVRDASEFSMAPLCWVEGRPVYKGDVLYRPAFGSQEFVADSVERDKDGDVFLRYTNGGRSSWLEGPEQMGRDMTWTPPKVKREGWMNCYKNGENSVYPTKEKADRSASYARVACIRIEWEE